MKIAICDDEVRDREKIKYFVGTHDTEHEIIEFSSTRPLLKRIYANESFDVLFLDIQMPDSNGWEVAEHLKQAKVNIYVVMVTINDNYVYDCFDRVNWFIPKPVTEAKIHKVLINAYDKFYPTIFEFDIGKTPVVLTAPEIVYLEVKRNDVYIHTINSVYKIRETLSNINKTFSLTGFSLTHQSYLINLDYYDAIDGSLVLLKNGEKVPLSRNKDKQFRNSLREHVIRRKSNV